MTYGFCTVKRQAKEDGRVEIGDARVGGGLV